MHNPGLSLLDYNLSIWHCSLKKMENHTLKKTNPGQERSVILYDGECAFCCHWIKRWQVWTGDTIDYLPFQEIGDRFPQISPEQYKEAIHLIDPSGNTFRGAQAVFKALENTPGKRWLHSLYIKVPLFAKLSESGYRLIARRRPFFSFLTHALWGRNLEPPTYRCSHWLFLRLLGFIFLIAFLSFGIQAEGLNGTQGIWPITEYLEQIEKSHDEGRLKMAPYLYAPTLFWLNASDTALRAIIAAGILFSGFLILGLATPITLIALWILYLSLCAGVPVFLNFQWDTLLLETAFMALFVAPWKWRDRLSKYSEPPLLGRLLIWWLLFRLMFQSGVVKLTSGDMAWWNLSALNYHYFTQPIPNRISWYFQQMPAIFQSASVVVMFAIELVAPFLIFGPRRMRKIGFWSLITLQILIAVSGNYGFFNLLATVLCITLIDDQSLPFKRFWRSTALTRAVPVWHNTSGFLSWLRTSVAIFVLGITSIQLLDLFKVWDLRNTSNERSPTPSWTQKISTGIAPFRSINTYGLFRVMTQERPEIIIEGSTDGTTWKPYNFHWKAGELSIPPPFVAPHMPRLDWQMWFAALRPDFRYTHNNWFLRFMESLLEGRPEVLSLLAENPFPEEAPRYIRAWRYQYTFTNPQTRRQTGNWWQRELIGPYSPTIQLNPSDKH